MMSATVVSAGAAASGYYKAEGYYIPGSDEEREASGWFGRGAEQLGLTGAVDNQIFSEMLDGQTFRAGMDGPERGDQIMGRYVDGERQHRPGLDLTFSAPKSLSVAALVLGDDRLVTAHDLAVKTAMAFVEENLLQTRKIKDGVVEVHGDGKMIAGLFRHDTSRLLDPQLHTHAVIVNQVDLGDGRYRAIHNDLIFEAQKIGSEIYRAELARSVQALGYEVDRVGKDRLIELPAIPEALTDTFSKRRGEIEAALAERGIDDNAKSAELAALATRTAKHKGLDREVLREAWLNEAEKAGMSREALEAIVLGARAQSARVAAGIGAPEPPALSDAKASLAQAITHISERALHYRENDLLATALNFARHADVETLQGAIHLAKRDGTLLELKGGNLPAGAISDAETLKIEREMAAMAKAMMKERAPSLTEIFFKAIGINRSPENALEIRLDRTTLTEGQKEAIVTSLTGRGQLSAIQGYAGTGKTFALEKLRTEAEKMGYKVEGLAPSSQAVSQLAEAIPGSETLQARLLRGRSGDPDSDPRKTILIVDEASMVSNKQMLDLLAQVKVQKIARLVLVGDVKQLDSVAAGTPFAFLQESGIKTAVMADIQRQRNDDALAVVRHAIAGDVAKAFQHIGDKISERPDLAKAAAETWLAMPDKDRQGTGLVTPSNKTREAINTAIREGLRAEGALAPDGVDLKVLRSLHMTRAEIADPRSYQISNIIVPHQSVASAGLTKGHQYEVIGIDRQASDYGEVGRSLTIRDKATGTTLPFSPAQNSKAAGAVNVFAENTVNFAVGDAVKFRIADKGQNILNGLSGQITRIDGESVHVADKAGQIRQVPIDSLAAKGLDHGYALTGHDFQGATVDRIIVAMSATEKLADQKSFYVAVSRPRDGASLITNDAERLAKRLEEQTGRKIASIETFLDQNRKDLAAQKEVEKTREEDRAKPENERTQGDKTNRSDKRGPEKNEPNTNREQHELTREAKELVREFAKLREERTR